MRRSEVRGVVSCAVAVVLLAGCGAAGRGDRVPIEGTTDARGCPHQTLADGQGISIDWVPMVVIGGVSYQQTIPEATVAASAVGASIGEVRCRIADEVVDPGYALAEGDATYLDPGTPLRAIAGDAKALRLAARSGEEWVVYEVVDVPGATTAADLLDLEGRVARLDLLGGDDAEQVLATVDAPAEVDRLVSDLLRAPLLDAAPQPDEQPLFLQVTLDDGSTLRRAWWWSAGVIQPRIVVPPALAAALAPPA